MRKVLSPTPTLLIGFAITLFLYEIAIVLPGLAFGRGGEGYGSGAVGGAGGAGVGLGAGGLGGVGRGRGRGRGRGDGGGRGRGTVAGGTATHRIVGDGVDVKGVKGV